MLGKNDTRCRCCTFGSLCNSVHWMMCFLQLPCSYMSSRISIHSCYISHFSYIHFVLPTHIRGNCIDSEKLRASIASRWIYREAWMSINQREPNRCYLHPNAKYFSKTHTHIACYSLGQHHRFNSFFFDNRIFSIVILKKLKYIPKRFLAEWTKDIFCSC